MGCSHLLTLEADVVGVFPHGVVQRLLVEFGRGGRDGIALHLILVLQSQETLPLRVVVEGRDRVQDLLQGWVGNRRVLGGREGGEGGRRGREGGREGREGGGREGGGREAQVCWSVGLEWFLPYETYHADGAEHEPECDSGSGPALGEGIAAAVVVEHVATLQLCVCVCVCVCVCMCVCVCVCVCMCCVCVRVCVCVCGYSLE